MIMFRAKYQEAVQQVFVLEDMLCYCKIMNENLGR
jgi:hypothetical protein